ncbi:LytR/AlgR family response regulator transcription factor [Flavobacterium sp.]|uniref:LytR/AlgR family response regulator transcription factor n=1 Tax=Flavobacterium sp. TaxID=239 RepID=UPI0039E262F3
MDTKLKCLLLDDELPGLAYLKMLCEQLPELEVIKAFNDPEKLLAEMDALDFDLLISDIEMPGIDGLTVAQKLQGKLVIFTTAYKEYAVDAFELESRRLHHQTGQIGAVAESGRQGGRAVPQTCREPFCSVQYR